MRIQKMAWNGGISYRSEQKKTRASCFLPNKISAGGTKEKPKYETKLSTCENAFWRTRMETNKSPPDSRVNSDRAVPRLVLVHETSMNGWRVPTNRLNAQRKAAPLPPPWHREAVAKQETRSELTWLVPYDDGDAWEARKSGRFLRRGSEAWEFRKGFGEDRGTKREWKETVDPRREGEQMRGLFR